MALKLFGLKRKTKAGPGEEILQFEEVGPPTQADGPTPAPGAAPSKLTPKQTAQRKYAAGMKQVRARAAKSKGGKGRIAKRSGATKMRRELGLKPGKAAKSPAKKAKGGKKKR